MPRNSSPLPFVLVGVGLIFADRLLAAFTPDPPAGDVDPGTGDDRPATMNTGEAMIVADTLEEAFWPGGLIALPYEDDEAAAAALMVARVTNDVRLIVNAYGTRGTTLFEQYTLPATVQRFLDNDLRAAVNADYAAKGIAIRF